MLGHFSHDQLFATLWTIAHQVPLSMGFSRQEWVVMASSRGSSQPRTKLVSLMSPALAGEFLPPEPPGNFFTSLNKFAFWNSGRAEEAKAFL